MNYAVKQINIQLVVVGLLLGISSGVDAQQHAELDTIPFALVAPRTAQFPLKTDRMFYSDDEIALARHHVATHAGAKRIADRIIKAADYWVDWKNQDIVDVMAGAQVPRAFDLNAKGCPIHGSEVFTVGGAYPWIVDPKHPFQVKSPIDGRMFPSNDFAAYYKSGFQQKAGWDTEYVDDGWGWVAPDGERYWFVAYANHWVWHRHVIPGIQKLARAYQLTGDQRYADKAVLMLHRLAEVYPSMNYEEQSRYGQMMKARNSVYRGKVVNAIWETGTVLRSAEAYDAVWESIDGNEALQQYLGKTGPEIREYIEANFLEEALRAFEENKVLGNFGMHQGAVLAVGLARQYADPEKYIRMILDEPGENRSKMGINYALYNQVFRDGFPLESPQYNFLWIRYIGIIANLLDKQGVDLFALPKVKRLLDGPIQTLAIGRYTPALGDGGNVLGDVTGRNAETYQSAFAAIGDSTYISWLNLSRDQYFTTYESLFREVVDVPGLASGNRILPPSKSRLFAGYGFGILNNKRDESALATTYGMHYAHYHWDFLNFELFANGQKMMPDIGYPDAMNSFVKEVYTWSLNTVSHNTVVVDEQRQRVNLPGTLHHFSEGEFAQSIDAQSPAYRQTNQYRRNLVQIAGDDGQTYVVDFFHVQGGKQHDYSLHGPPGEVVFTDHVWGAVQPGTLAGADVGWGEIYDNSLLESKGDSIGYNGYVGSGYQYLFNVQKAAASEASLVYKHVNDTNARLKIHMMPHNDQQVYIADAYGKPRAKNHVLKYMIARRKSREQTPLNSTFIGVFETYQHRPFIQAAERLALTGGNGTALAVTRQQHVDVIVRDTVNTIKTIREYGIETDANTAVVTFNMENKLQRVYFTDGTYLKVGGDTFTDHPIQGKIRAVNFADNEVLIDLVSGDLEDVSTGFDGIYHFTNPYRTTVHPAHVADLTGKTLRLKLHDDILVGYFGVATVKDHSLTSDTELNFFHQYGGTTLLDANLNPIGQVVKAGRKHVELADGFSSPPDEADKVWIANIWKGDTVTFKTVFSWQTDDKEQENFN
ncbi:heparinase II/III domain-containing protein [Parapedobacter sp. 10938]|uniref:heparinase II/III domain-containing protein n=1 Tax=Parapedobacter flavus TaxID=3110225 RepID=UPI002DBD225D|nr:heparinase II/III family protein [Parapedobacter sp. 10938]MEC3878311.1 heparinase II/III family protein [Parapedobacter sp. 10938]